MIHGKTVRLFFVDGDAAGLVTAEIHNWTGHILLVPRDRTRDAFMRPEASKTGLYLLLGEENGIRKAYVGEADVIAERIRAHERDDDKDFYEQVCFVTSKDSNLTKAHVRYLESRVVSVSREVGRVTVVNKTEPASGYLSESDVADMEYFLSQLQILLSALGIDLLRPKPQRIVADLAKTSLVSEPYGKSLELVLRHESGADARALEVAGEIVVLKGSRGSDRANASNSYAALRTSLIQDGRLILVAGQYTEFADDVTFASPSAAAAVVNNRNSAGPREWRLENTGQTLKEWREQQVGAAYDALSRIEGT